MGDYDALKEYRTVLILSIKGNIYRVEYVIMTDYDALKGYCTSIKY